jgi:hypothetical protein
LCDEEKGPEKIWIVLSPKHVKVKFTPELATMVQTGGRYSCTLSLTSALDRVDGRRHAPAALSPGKRLGTHCIGGWVGPRASLDGCGNSSPPAPGIRSPDRPARSESLYRLSYPGPRPLHVTKLTIFWATFTKTKERVLIFIRCHYYERKGVTNTHTDETCKY